MYATTIYAAVESAGATYSVTFASLDPTHVKVSYVSGGSTYILTYGTEYTVNTARTQVTVLIALPEATTVKIYRETPKALSDFPVNFQNGSVLRAGDLNLATKHLLYLIQEYLDRIEDAGLGAAPDLAELRADITALEAGFIGAAAFAQRTATLWAPIRRSDTEGYKPKRLRSRRTAGAVGDVAATGPTYLPVALIGDGGSIASNHGATNHLYPYMVFTGVDYYGVPHNRHKRLRGTSAGNDSGELGYQFGHDVAAGDIKTNVTFKWKLTGAVENAGWADAFLEFAVEVNPTVAVYDGPNLARLVSPGLAATWTGERPLVAEIVAQVTGPSSWKVKGDFTIYADSGEVLVSWSKIAEVNAADHNWLTDAGRVQLRTRVDRDQATRLNTFTGENQGARQGANTLRLHIDTYDFEILGLNETR